jgi:4'-phosphopantetheinyl transferase
MLAMALPHSSFVWITDSSALPDPVLAAYSAWLGDDERQRCTSFVRVERRRQFLTGRALLRRALGQLLGVGPAAVVLRERPGQGPALAFPAAPAAGFSISHSGSWVACAVSMDTSLGLDIERIDPERDLLALAEHAFEPEEVERLRLHNAQELTRAFYRMWCEHEARIKLAGSAVTTYNFEYPALSGSLVSARPLVAAPVIEIVSLGLD